MTSFIDNFCQKGYLHQCTDMVGLSALMQQKSIAAYIGFDCTAKSLHVGSLMQIMILRLLQQSGHRPIVIVGGGTTKIGDPSFKDEARPILSDADIAENIAGIKKSLSKFINFGDGENDALLINNDEWLSNLNYLDFLRDYGRHFSINRMLSFDSVKLRLEREQSLSFLEFNYMILQAYDFVELHKRYNCMLQIGGSDQWGNIINGVELNRRLGQEEVFGLTTPLLATASGAKMGKTTKGAVWLNEDLLSPYEYYQYWRNTEDLDVIRFLRMYTELAEADILKYAQLQGSELNEVKKVLAFEATKLCHGELAAKSAAETATKLFEQGVHAADLPCYLLKKSELVKGILAVDLFYKSGIVTSKGEAKRLIQGMGAKINNQVIENQDVVVKEEHLQQDQTVLLSAGKKKHLLVKVC
jgi:tyrosyl-tRNA synthetase